MKLPLSVCVAFESSNCFCSSVNIASKEIEHLKYFKIFSYNVKSLELEKYFFSPCL